MPRATPPPGSFLPLTPVVFEILLSLAAGPRHGYSIMQEVETRSRGAVRLRAGSLYRALARLLDDAIVEELDGRPAADLDDERRRYYRLTRLGQRVAAAESRRLVRQIGVARSRRLLRQEDEG